MISTKSSIVKLLLGFYFLHPEQSFYVNEIVNRLSVDKRNLVKKLKELEREGFFISDVRGNQKYYFLNKKYALYKEYKNIFMKTIGFEERLRTALSNVKGIKEAYIYGSYAKDTMDAFSDIDIVIIGSQDTIAVQKEIGKLQKEMDREINVLNISAEEFDARKNKQDRFVIDILQNSHIKII